MEREPEPLERVRALVCEPCWVNCFDTEGFEQLGHGGIDGFKYNITAENLQAGIRTGCTWCSTIYRVFPQLEPFPQTYEISLYTVSNYVTTPPGCNFYRCYLNSELPGRLRSARLEFFTEYDNFAAQRVHARKSDQDVTPSKTSAQISRWLEECVQHPCCPQQTDLPLPTRLIEVATTRICHTNGAFGKFAALSYCWGTGSQIQLRSDNIETLSQHLVFNDLPQTIKDAVLVTRSLSIPYLWVDALCIVQNDAEDKAREIGSMAQIYSNAYIVILASNASDAAHGFLAHCDAFKASDARIPFRIAPNRFGSVTARTYVLRSLSIKAEDNPLSTRAWALQEQMMATRTLAYTKRTLEWRCASGVRNLNNSLNVYTGTHYAEVQPKLISQLSANAEDALLEWLRIVQNYSRRDMSIQSDKLPAIAALAERFSAVLGHYHAGLWGQKFIRQLCWGQLRLPRPERRCNLYRAPSWSWASVNETVSWYLGSVDVRLSRTLYSVEDRDEDCCKLVSVEVRSKNTQVPYGEVAHASIKIYGKVIIASITPDESSWSYQRYKLIYADSVTTELPLQRFYRTYFNQATKSTVPSRRSAARASVVWDHEDFRTNPFTVLLLPLQYYWKNHPYYCYNDRERLCRGLVLIPAGPGIVQRIGMFKELLECEMANVGEQEITIV